MDVKLPVAGLVTEAWGLALRAALPSLPWLAGLMVAAGLYRLALYLHAGAIINLLLLVVVFAAGVGFSLRAYRSMLGASSGTFLKLAHANLSIYMAFLFVGVFIAFFLAILPGILLEVSGRTDLDAKTDPAIVQAAFMDMLPTAYGAVFILACALGLWALCFFAIRLLLVGAATVSHGETMVFRTWPWTKGHALRLSVAAMATHVGPFFAAIAINAALAPLLGTAPAGLFIGGALGVLLLTPFLLAGHGLAVSALPRLVPDAAELREIATSG
ncbi:hypothetical protein [Hyphomonas chukchiensis]|uniref:hypothetical protein n=1 Tax=Hyphomonas chukchiensis TaxID=1280947 RepID=UPI0030F81464